MLTLIVLPDGTEVFSGDVRNTAIVSSTITESVNSGTELTLGSTCSSMLECKIILKDKQVLINAGDEVQLYKVLDDGTRHKVGLFTCEKPTRSGSRMLNLTAYDRVSWLDRDLAEWMNSLTGWPYSLLTFARMTCQQCGLELLNTSIPNGNYRVKKFKADSITGRQIISWAGEISGRFARATPDGKIEFAWYTPSEKEISASDSACRITTAYNNGKLSLDSKCLNFTYSNGNLTVNSDDLIAEYDNGEVKLSAIKRLPYYMGSFNYEEYSVKKIEKVQIQFSDKDIGTIYPDIKGERNTYKITGNYLLTAHSGSELKPIAETIYNQLKDVTYVPCKINVPANFDISAGNIVIIKDRDGKEFTTYVMQKKQTGSRDSLECFGNRERESTTAINNHGYKALEGKYMNLETDVDGIRAEVGDLSQQQQSNFNVLSDRISAKVSSYGGSQGVNSFSYELTATGFKLTSNNEVVMNVTGTEAKFGVDLSADHIKGGKVSSLNGNSVFDLNDGTFKVKDSSAGKIVRLEKGSLVGYDSRYDNLIRITPGNPNLSQFSDVWSESSGINLGGRDGVNIGGQNGVFRSGPVNITGGVEGNRGDMSYMVLDSTCFLKGCDIDNCLPRYAFTGSDYTAIQSSWSLINPGAFSINLAGGSGRTAAFGYKQDNSNGYYLYFDHRRDDAKIRWVRISSGSTTTSVF